MRRAIGGPITATVSLTVKADKKPNIKAEAYMSEYLDLNLDMNMWDIAASRPEDSARDTRLNIPIRNKTTFKSTAFSISSIDVSPETTTIKEEKANNAQIGILGFLDLRIRPTIR
jgi:hypothetical protein